MHCGKRLRELITLAGFQFKDFAEQINTPPTTLSNWFKWEDIPLQNIRRCCDILNLKLWEFFWEDNIEIPDYYTAPLT